MAATIDDSQLLADYVRTRSTDALGQLIERHIDFVHAAAVRQVHDAALAEDVTQAVFIILTRKAASIRPESLIGWLFNTTRYCAANARNSELRRRRHERQAAKPEVQMPSDHSIAVPLDNALAALRSTDRQVVLLRFMEQRDFADVATVLGISEQTARRRLSRAVERLRHLLSAAGSLLPSAAVLETLSTATPKAPVHLLAKTIATATAGAASTSAAVSLAAQTIHMMTWLKMKILATIILAVAITGVTSVAIVNVVGPAPAAAPNPPSNLRTVPPVAAPAASTVATFPDGLRVEILGIAPSPIRNQKWWRPDGSPLPQPPIRRDYGKVTVPLSKVYTFVTKLTGADPTWDTSVNVEGSHGSASSDQGNLLCNTVALTESPTATIDFICATGPWQTRAIISADALYKTGVNLNGIVFAPGDDPKTNTVKLSADHASMNALFTGDAIFVAIDLNNKIVSSSGMQGQGGLLSETKTYSFTKLRPDQIKEFQIRSRPFNRTATFRNISLIPDQLTIPTVEQHDGGKFVASFTAGGGMEVMGISDLSSPHKWWNADGSDREEIPLAKLAAGAIGNRPGDKTYAIAVKWNHQGADNPAVKFSFSNLRSVTFNNAQQMIPDSPDVYILTYLAGVTSSNFHAGMASGPWQIGPTVIPDGRATSVTVDKDRFDFSALADQNGEATITVADTLSDVERQLVVTDMSGATHIAHLTRSTWQGAAYQNLYRVRGVASAQIKSYQFQTRRFEYINFNNITLKPDQHTDITIEPDGPPTPTVAPKPPGEEGL